MDKNTKCGLKVLITGSEGFTGKYMRLEMESFGYKVYRSGTNTSIKSSNYFILNLLNVESIRSCLRTIQPDIIIHLAAIAYVGHDNIQQFYEVNTVGTRNLLAVTAQLSKKPKSILIASSANVYGNSGKSVLSEHDEVFPTNDYAVSKLAMEYVAKIYMHELPIIITRPFNYTGVGQDTKFLIPKIVEHFKQHKNVIELGNLKVYREFNDVRFVVSTYRQLIENNVTDLVCNICSGKMYSLQNIIQLCEKISNQKIKININPNFVRKNEIAQLSGDNTKLSELIRLSNIYSIEETLEWMLLN